MFRPRAIGAFYLEKEYKQHGLSVNHPGYRFPEDRRKPGEKLPVCPQVNSWYLDFRR